MVVSEWITRNRRTAVVDILKGLIYAVYDATMLSLVNFTMYKARIDSVHRPLARCTMYRGIYTLFF